MVPPPGKYEVATWADAKDSQNPNLLVFEKRTMGANATLHLDLASAGGEVVRIRPVEK